MDIESEEFDTINIDEIINDLKPDESSIITNNINVNLPSTTLIKILLVLI